MAEMRAATAGDAAFLGDILAVAADWREGTFLRSGAQIARDPDLGHYLAGWPQDGDVGVIADVAGSPVGATWCRYFDAERPGYGFVAPDVPELTIGVLPVWRRRGIGRRLLTELIHQARQRSILRISLSVEADNPALTLYADLGFVEVSRTLDSPTMVLDTTVARTDRRRGAGRG